tara:strand:- start:1155 stop:1913 length:759 start_codon:yes stop_codon:yes gene_type:complete
MIISKKNKYIFIGIPLSGSSSIINELIQNYDGESYHHKHSDFTILSKKERLLYNNFKVIAVLRDPIEIEFTAYNKLIQNSEGQYTSKERFIENGGYTSRFDRFLFKKINDLNLSFEDYLLLKFKFRPYNNQFSLNCNYVNHIIRFKNLNNDFKELIKDMNLEVKRELPQINKTKNKKIIPDLDHQLKKRIFSPFIYHHRKFYSTDFYPQANYTDIISFKVYNQLWKKRKSYISKRYLNKSFENKKLFWKLEK